ncbi:phosducin-like protein 2 [Condylostylus longicornis]|uniref:phosducin-like protein 2 n=1 Tax=Condylostylus longicornis TaxID=2530218 RepID=UPI00244DDB73|nr:phosducin-like protein 2 [Condylostylus longicornis]
MSTTNPTEVTTEWDELQIKYGNYPERQKPITGELLSNLAIDFAESQDVLESKNLEQLELLEDELEEDTLEAYRKKRLEELKRQRDAYKFGEVVHVGKDGYVNEVTEASKAIPGEHVVIHLYAEGKPVCELINRAFVSVARRNGNVKFFSRASVWGRESVTPECVEWVLWKNGVLASAPTEEDPRTKESSSLGNKRTNNIRYDDDREDEDENERNADRRGYSSLHMERALRLK